MERPILQVQGLCFGYPGRPLLAHWSVQIRQGVSLLLGGDGAGKTTVLRLLAGAQAAQSGTLVLNGEALRAGSTAYLAQVFWAEPRSAGWDALTPADWWAQQPSHHPHWDAAALERHADGFHLVPHLHKPMYQLSTGSRRKVLMAAGLASGAALTLLDEPLAGLDRPSIQYLQQALVGEAAQSGRRAILVAHYEALAGVPWRDTFVLPD